MNPTPPPEQEKALNRATRDRDRTSNREIEIHGGAKRHRGTETALIRRAFRGIGEAFQVAAVSSLMEKYRSYRGRIRLRDRILGGMLLNGIETRPH